MQSKKKGGKINPKLENDYEDSKEKMELSEKKLELFKPKTNLNDDNTDLKAMEIENSIRQKSELEKWSKNHYF